MLFFLSALPTPVLRLWATTVHMQQRGSPSGGTVGEGGIFIIPYSECFQGFLVKPNDELVWDLGQTCEAARNGTIFFIDKNPLTIYTIINFIFKIVVGFENTEKRRNFNDRSSFFLFMQKKNYLSALFFSALNFSISIKKAVSANCSSGRTSFLLTSFTSISRYFISISSS